MSRSKNLLIICLAIVMVVIPRSIHNLGNSTSKAKRIVYRVIEVLAIVLAFIMVCLLTWYIDYGRM